MNKTINIGVLGGANVAEWALLRPSKEIAQMHVKAIASRDLQKAQAIAKRHQIPHVFSSYQELLSLDELDLIYIPLVNSLHAKWIYEAALQGKNVFVEKPMCLTLEEAEWIQEIAVNNRVQIYEGVMTQYHPWQDTIIEMIKSQKYGALIEIDTLISTHIKEGEDNFRLNKTLGGGAFYDESSYWLQMIQKIVGFKKYQILYAKKEINKNDIDLSFTTALRLDHNIKSHFVCTFKGQEQAEHTFRFEQAIVKAKNIFRCCYGSYKYHLEVCSLDNKGIQKITYEPQSYYTNQLLSIADSINATYRHDMLKESLERIRVMNEIYAVAVGGHSFA